MSTLSYLYFYFGKRCVYFFHHLFRCIHLLAFFLCIHGAVSAVEELPLEELHRDDSEDKHEELVHNEDVEHVLQ